MLTYLQKLARTALGIKAAPTVAPQPRVIRGTYDAARTTNEFSNYWANSDAFDADSANSKAVRHTLMQRSRYEIGSSGFADGMASTYTTDLVGVGPTLRMQTGSDGFNRMVELRWFLWCEAIRFSRKLWTMAHAKHVDGECFAVMRRNPRVNHDIKIDLVLYEADQIQTPWVPFSERGYIDGMKFDDFGNVIFYDLLRDHPGAQRYLGSFTEVEKIPADKMLHWFKMRRPGQHRGVPECASTLNVGAAARRWREATIAALETAADFSAVLESELPPDANEAPVLPFDATEIEKRMLVALPYGTKLSQLEAKQPTTAFAEVSKSLVNERARPMSMPYNKAACDSSSYNYASGRLDHQTYYAALDVERHDCNAVVLDPLFNAWFDLAIVRYGWLGGNPEAVGPGARLHIWDWPKHRVADVESEANANETKLTSGQIFPHTLFSDAGLDFEDELDKAATTFGITVDEMRKRLLDTLYPEQKKPAAKPNGNALDAVFNRLKPNGVANGHH